MTQMWMTMIVLICFTLCARAATTRPTTGPSTQPALRIVAIGDSITHGASPASATGEKLKAAENFVSRVGAGLESDGIPVEMFNAGVGGNRSDQGLARFDADVLSHHPDIVLILFGANDQVYEENAAGPRVTVEDYAKNLREMATRARAAGARPILMTPTPLGSHWHGPKHPIYEGGRANNAVLPKYVAAVRTVAREMDVPLVDLAERWARESSETIDSWEPDGVHPNAQGHAIIADEILRAVRHTR